MQVVIFTMTAYPTGKDILNLEWVFTELFGSSNRILFEIFPYLILQLRIYAGDPAELEEDMST